MRRSTYKGGREIPVFDIGPCKVGIVICYDNQFPETARVLALRGADVILMPHAPTGHCMARQQQVALDRGVQTIGNNPATYKDYHDLLDRKDLDAVFVITPLYVHYPLTRDVLLSGRHVFCEKCLVFKPEEVHALRALSNSRPKQVMQTGLQRRYSQFYQMVKDMVDKRILGNVHHIHAQWHRNMINKPSRLWTMKPVNPVPDQAGTISGSSVVCAGQDGVAYSVAPIANAVTYVWALPPNASIASGAGTNSITVNFADNATSGDIFVYGNNLCGNGGTSPAFLVTVNPLPDSAGTISGPSDVCVGASGVIYSVAPIANATGYLWTVPAGVLITAGNNTSSITVTFTSSAVSGDITVQGTNSCGNGTVSPNFAVTVNPIPPTPVVTNHGDTLHSSAPNGNQWYFEGTLLAGATGQTYVATQQGYYWDIVTINGCSSDSSNHKLILLIGIAPHPASVIKLYPVPNDGRFNVSITTASEESFSFRVYNNLGVMIYEETKIDVKGSLIRVIDISTAPNGMYTVVITSDQETVVRRIIVNY